MCIMEFNEPILKEGLTQILTVAKERAQTIENLKQALLDGDESKIKFYASQICGLTNESSRISKSINTRTGRG